MARPRASTQRALTVLKPLRDPLECAALKDLLRDYGDRVEWRRDEARAIDDPLKIAFDKAEGLHFLSWFVIEKGVETPLLALEANVDGPEDDFLRRLVDDPVARPVLETIYGYCLGPGETLSVRWLIEGRLAPELFYVARPGQSARQVQEDAALAATIDAIVANLPEPRGRRLEHVRLIWDRLAPGDRARLCEPTAKPFWVRFSLREHPVNLLLLPAGALALLGLVPLSLLLLQALGVPLWGPLLPPPGLRTLVFWSALLLAAALFAAAPAGAILCNLIEAPRDIAFGMRLRVWGKKALEMLRTTAKALPAALAALAAVAFVGWCALALRACLGEGWWLILVACATLGIVLLAAMILLRLVLIAMQELVEDVDPVVWDPADLRPMRAREDRGVQNHFISVTDLKPGWLRRSTLRAVLKWINLLSAIFYDRRGLGGISTIHFARWQIINRGRQLLFVTNYDGGWAGYLGDFVALVGPWMNAIWGNTAGFPRTFYLAFDGVQDEQRFKCFARRSQQETLFWYQRYPQLSLAAIRRNAELREELAGLVAYLDPASGHADESALDAFLRRFAIPGR